MDRNAFLNLNQLKALKQTGFFSGAANRIGLTQPAVSIQLRNMNPISDVALVALNPGNILEGG